MVDRRSISMGTETGLDHRNVHRATVRSTAPLPLCRPEKASTVPERPGKPGSRKGVRPCRPGRDRGPPRPRKWWSTRSRRCRTTTDHAKSTPVPFQDHRGINSSKVTSHEQVKDTATRRPTHRTLSGEPTITGRITRHWCARKRTDTERGDRCRNGSGPYSPFPRVSPTQVGRGWRGQTRVERRVPLPTRRDRPDVFDHREWRSCVRDRAVGARVRCGRRLRLRKATGHRRSGRRR